MSFTNNPILTIFYDKKDKNTKVLTHETLTWADVKYTILVPEMFVSDGASIPMEFWQIVGHPLSGQNIRPALLHDFLCKEGQERRNTDNPLPYSWQEVHEIFRQALLYECVPGWKANTMKNAVYGNWLVHPNLKW